MLLQFSVSGLTHCMMTGVKVAAFRRGTGSKKLSLVEPPKLQCSSSIFRRLYFFLENKLFWTRLFMKCETAMSLQYWFQSTMEYSFPIFNSCWAFATDTHLDFPALQARPSICHKFKCNFSKKLPCLMLILFWQHFTG